MYDLRSCQLRSALLPLCSALALICLPAMAEANTSGTATSATTISAQQVILWAVHNAEQVHIAEAQQQAASARSSAAWRRLGPTATLIGTWTHRTQAASALGQENNALAASGEIAMSLWDPSAAPMLRAARYLEKAQNYSTDIAKRDIAFAAAEAYMSASVAQLELRAAEERQITSAQAVSEAEVRYRAGLIAEDVLLQFELDLAQAEFYASTARTALRRALSVLQLLTHQSIEALQIAPAVTDATLPNPASLASTQPLALREEVAAYDARIRAAGAVSREPRLRILPSLSASARYNASTELSLLNLEPYWTIQALARWPLWDGGVRYAEARAARAEVEALELERSGYMRQLEANIALARIEIDAAEADLAAARKRHALTRRHERAIDGKFRAGLASAMERSNAYTAALDANANLAAAAARVATSRNTYDELTGKWPYGITLQQLEQAQP